MPNVEKNTVWQEKVFGKDVYIVNSVSDTGWLNCFKFKKDAKGEMKEDKNHKMMVHSSVLEKRYTRRSDLESV